MPLSQPSILDLADDELVPYHTILQALAQRPYESHNITIQVIGELRDVAQTDPSTARVAQRLIDLLQDNQSVAGLITALPERSLSYPAALILGWFGSRASHAVPALIEAIGWGPTNGVGAAATAVVRIGGDPTPLFDGLMRSLDEANDDAFVQLLGIANDLELSSNAGFISIVEAAAHNLNPTIRERAAEAIGAVPGEMQKRLANVIASLKTDSNQHVQEAIRVAVQP